MRDMKTKFGAEVESFRYAFVLPKHGREWDENALAPEAARKALAAVPTPAVRPFECGRNTNAANANAANAGTAPGQTALRRRATDKQPTFIEIRPRAE